jgi:hypothetical protein
MADMYASQPTTHDNVPLHSFLCLMIIFKGQHGKHVMTRKLPLHDPILHYLCQRMRWMDKICTHEWVDIVLAVYLEDTSSPLGIVHQGNSHSWWIQRVVAAA